MNHFHLGLAIGAAYLAVAAVAFGFLSKRWGFDGPDGLVPILGAIFWPVVLPLWLAWRALRLLAGLGAALAPPRDGR